MKYTLEEILFDDITPREFENLCYDLLVKYNFQNLIWREGGADSGRDIEATLNFNNSIKNSDTKWFFECKRYTSGGVPPDDLSSKLTWADAEQPDFLVFFISSYLTNGSRVWLDKIKTQKHYKILVIEGEDLKNRLIKYPELIERYFSLNRYDQLFKDIKNFKTKFNIKPSFEFLREIINNVDLSKLSSEEVGFILINFYSQFDIFEARNDYYGDFDNTMIFPLLDYLKENIENTELKSFSEFQDNNDPLGGTGIFDEMYWFEHPKDISEMKNYNFQHYDLHLNHKLDSEKWKIGEYLLIIYEDVAFELFKTKETEIRIIKDFSPEKIEDISYKFSDNMVEDYKKYIDNFSA